MANLLVSALIGGVLALIALVVMEDLVTGTDTTSWSSINATLGQLLPTAVGIVGIVGTFMLLTKFR